MMSMRTKLHLTRTETGDFNKNKYTADGIGIAEHNKEIDFRG